MQGMGAQSNGDSPSASHAYPSGEADLASLHAPPSHAEVPFSDRRCTYLKKTYLKTASRAAEKARYKEVA